MKIIKYKINIGTDKETLFEKELLCPFSDAFEKSLAIAESEAVGEITVEGEFEAGQPSQLDRIEAQATYTAMMTDTLLEV